MLEEAQTTSTILLDNAGKLQNSANINTEYISKFVLQRTDEEEKNKKKAKRVSF